MQFNTIPFKNTDIEKFVGRFEGEDYEIQPGEIRYFPSHVSEHLSKQLVEKIIVKFPKEKGRVIDRETKEKKLLGEILGGEIITERHEQSKTVKDMVLKHEAQVKQMFVEEEKKKQAERIEAMKLVE